MIDPTDSEKFMVYRVISIRQFMFRPSMFVIFVDATDVVAVGLAINSTVGTMFPQKIRSLAYTIISSSNP